jgi:hypothetical protein
MSYAEGALGSKKKTLYGPRTRTKSQSPKKLAKTHGYKVDRLSEQVANNP